MFKKKKKIKITHLISVLKYSVLKSQRLFEFKVRWKRWISINFWVTSCKLPAAKFQAPLQLLQFTQLKYRNNFCRRSVSVIAESFTSQIHVFFFLFQWSFFNWMFLDEPAVQTEFLINPIILKLMTGIKKKNNVSIKGNIAYAYLSAKTFNVSFSPASPSRFHHTI